MQPERHHEAMIQVRRMTTGDEALVQQAESLFDQPFDEAAARAFLASPTDHLLLAFVDGRVAGFALAHELPRPDTKATELFLNEIATDEGFRRLGVGRALLAALRELGRRRGMGVMFVFADADDDPAIRFYLGTGGERIEPGAVMFDYSLER